MVLTDLSVQECCLAVLRHASTTNRPLKPSALSAWLWSSNTTINRSCDAGLPGTSPVYADGS